MILANAFLQEDNDFLEKQKMEDVKNTLPEVDTPGQSAPVAPAEGNNFESLNSFERQSCKITQIFVDFRPRCCKKFG